MSASLVGSEMCIRDSLLLRSTGVTCRRANETPRGPSSLLSPGADTLEPVSYTHLTLPTICSV
eukprot:8336182-Alexandrium_andersonii.AAC.1